MKRAVSGSSNTEGDEPMNPTSPQIQPAQIDATAKPARFVINAEVEGFPVVIEVEGKADALKTMIDRLKSIGATPPASKSSSAKTGVPVCPVHNSPMKASRKPGSYFCPKRLSDGDYCPEKA
jgi:hypothetical protein